MTFEIDRCIQFIHYELLSGPAQKQNDNNFKNTWSFSIKRKHNGNGGHFEVPLMRGGGS